MSPFLKYSLLLLVVLALLTPVGIYVLSPPRTPAPSSTPLEPPIEPPALSILGENPDWSELDIYQKTITRGDFERLLTTIFTTGDAWRSFIEFNETEARIRTGGDTDSEIFRLQFAPVGSAHQIRRDWKTTAELPPAPAEKPLDRLHIAIDPGHIGGEWAKLEERWFIVGEGTPVREGDMTLKVANLLKPQLEALGATVSLVRAKAEPVTPLRPADLLDLAAKSLDSTATTTSIQKTAERFFYRTAEIRARAKLVNETLKPDLVLCLHFNAEAWGDPANPTLIDRSHFHLLLNGAYSDDEVSLADQRFAMLRKLLSHTHAEEALIGGTVADTFVKASKLPPFIYPTGATNVLPVNENPYLWARNLLANRLYDCPVIFTEPYVMNSTIDYPRIQAGNYDGLREIAGKPKPSIFREYADSLALGLARHYSQHRKTAPTVDGRIEVTRDDRLAFAWQLEPLATPTGGEPFAASAFLHPFCTPSGFQTTTIQPSDHLHHFGIWWPWKFIEVDGVRHNCWEIQEGQGALVARSVKPLFPSLGRIGLELQNVVELRGADSTPKPVITETTQLIFNTDDPSANVLDLAIRQHATGSPVTIVNYRYSGFTWRGPASWNKDNSQLLTSEGLGRDEANGTPARWVLVTGPTPAGAATVLMMSAAQEIAGTPERLRVWDSNAENGAPFVNFNPVSKTALPLDDAHPAVSNRRYRMIAADREIDAAAAEAEWRNWIQP